ncbi:MAG: VPDSG-CTERM sorting domain-containing protein [Verrucomicrobia bacterium]|nr:VPDSG-CTERM sorting domain-containing protein [Verrucomicrobiota bacterium]
MKKTSLLLAGVLALASLAKATPAFDFSSGGGVTGWTGTTYSLGYTFNVSDSFSFNALGIYDQGSNGLVSSHAVGVWDSGGTLVASTTVSGFGTASDVSVAGNGSWVYQSLGSTVSLSAGNYTIAAYYGSSSGDQVMYGGSVSGLIENVSGLTYTGYAFSDYGLPGLTQPFYTGGSSEPFYFGPNLSMVGASGVPDGGSTLVLLGLALTAAVGFRRKFGA